MTATQDKVRALVLATLMVLSVFAGTVAFTGTVAAATAGGGTVSPTAASPDSTNSYTVTYTVLGLNSGDSTQQRIVFDFDDRFDMSGATVTPSVNDTGSATIASTSVDTTTDEVTVVLDDTGASTDEDVEVSLSISSLGTNESGSYGIDASFDNGNDGDFADAPDFTDTGFATVNVEGNDPRVRKAIHYDQDPSSGTDPIVELAFTEDVSLSGVSGNWVLYYENDSMAASVPTSSVSVTDGGRVVVQLTQQYPQVETISVPGGISDTAGNQFSADRRNVSVTTAPVTVDAETANPDTDTVTDSAYRGTNVTLYTGEENMPLSIDGPGDYNLQRSSGENSHVYVWNTNNVDFGDYDIDTDTDGDIDANVSVENLGLTLNLDEESFTDEEDIEGNVTSNGFDRPVKVVLVDSDDDDVETEFLSVDADGEVDFNFGTQDTDNYTIEVTDLDSGVELTSDSFQVVAARDNVANYAEATITNQRGDMVEITINIQGTDTATLAIGNYEDDNYQANITVEDGDDDGEVIVEFNTYTAGTGVSESSIVTVDDDDDDVEDFEQSSTNLDLLDSTDVGYEMNVRAGSATGAETVDDPDNVGTLFLDARETGSLRTWTAPGDTSLSDLDEEDEIVEAVGAGELTPDETIAREDIIVYQVNASGLSGLFDFYSSDDTNALEGALDAGTLNITNEQTGDTANIDENELFVLTALQNDAAEAVLSDDGQVIYVVVDLQSAENADAFIREPEDGTEFEANFSVSGTRILDEGSAFNSVEKEKNWENATNIWTIVDRELDFDEDPYEVPPTGGVTVSGTTNVAPGTEITVRVRSTEDTQPRFIYTNDSVIVQQDGTWSTTFDFSNQSVGDTFEVRVTGAGFDEDIDGEVVEAQTTTTETETETETETTTETETETTTEMETETTTEMETETTTAEPTETETQTQTPGFGVIVAIVALLAAALLAIRRD